MFIPFTRLWCVDRFFDALLASDVPLTRCSVIAYVDSEDERLAAAVIKRVEALPCPDARVHITAWAPPAESASRRDRHAAMRCASVGLIPKAKQLLLLEDDTLIPDDSWKLLSEGIEAGYDWVSGFEAGRWSARCPGIWKAGPVDVRTMTPGDGLEECDATGLYLALTTPEVYRSQPWDEWDNAIGHDVSLTYRMTLAGYRLGVDWRLRCIHMTEKGDITCEATVPVTHPCEPFRPIIHTTSHTPLTAFQPTGPRLARGGDGRTPTSYPRMLHYPIRIGVDCELDGTKYPAGSRIDRPTAVALRALGQLKDTRIL